VEDIPSGWVWQHQQPLVVRDLEQETRFPRVMEALREHSVRSFCCLPLTTAHRRLGAIAFGRTERGAYSPAEVAFAQLVAAHVAVAVDNALHAQEAQALQQQLAREHDRLHVFPLTVPPLRERLDDIPLLVHHFVRTNAQRLRKRIDTIPADALDALASYHWPGNVRELQNIIERAVILTPDPVLRLPPAEWQRSREVPEAPASGQTLEEVERAHIIQALRDTNWVIGGPHGAAARLGMRRTSLIYRLEKLGIPRRPA
jgi:transcriptional regulator with GAF, ATPase, and Fis domain